MAGDAAKMVVTGGEALTKKLTSLRKRDTRAAVNSGLTKGSAVFRKALKANIPKQVDGVSETNLKLLKRAIKSTKTKAKPRGANAVVRGRWTGIAANVFLDVGAEEDSIRARS